MARRTDGNGLRSPTLDEMDSLPTSIDEAKKRGLNVFIDENGDAIKIRFKNRKKPDSNGLRAEYESLENWRGRNALQPGKRNENERLSTPEGADRKAFNKAMTDARRQGKQGDHNYSVARTGNALRDMSPDRQALYHQRFRDAGIALGNQADNITPLDSYTNEVIKQAEERTVDRSIKNAGSVPDQIFGQMRRAVSLRRGMSIGGNLLMAIGPDLMEIADSKTDGAISEGINQAVDAGKELVVDGINGLKQILTSMVGQDVRQKAINYGQY